MSCALGAGGGALGATGALAGGSSFTSSAGLASICEGPLTGEALVLAP